MSSAACLQCLRSLCVWPQPQPCPTAPITHRPAPPCPRRRRRSCLYCFLYRRTALVLYRQILDAIEANDYNNFTQRAYVPKWRKLLSLPAAYLKGSMQQL